MINHRASKQIRIFFFSFLLRIYLEIFETKYVTLHRYSTSNSARKNNFPLAPTVNGDTLFQTRLLVSLTWLNPCVSFPQNGYRLSNITIRPSDIRCDGISFNELDNRESSWEKEIMKRRFQDFDIEFCE